MATDSLSFEGFGLNDEQIALQLLSRQYEPLEQWTVVSFSDNKLKDAGNVLFHKLVNVTELNLDNNQLKTLPESLKHLKALKLLNLESNHFEVVPKVFIELPQLQELYLYGNRLTGFLEKEDAQKLSKLTSITLSSNRFTAVPESLKFIPTLESLILSDNNIASIPQDFFTSLPSLSFLDLSNNLLSSLPEDISSLLKLTALILSDNQFKEVPEDLFCHLSLLRELALSRNQIRRLPWKLGALQELQLLYLHENPITDAPPELLNNKTEIFADGRKAAEFIHDLFRVRTQASNSDNNNTSMPKTDTKAVQPQRFGIATCLAIGILVSLILAFLAIFFVEEEL